MKMRLAVLAPEYGDEMGGMQEHARQLVSGLAAQHQVILFIGRDAKPQTHTGHVEMRPEMTWDRAVDAGTLAGTMPDAWLLLNAGLSPYLRGLHGPGFVYVHGNDLVSPWYPDPGRTFARLRAMLPSEAAHRMLQWWRRSSIAASLPLARLVFANSNFTRTTCIEQVGLAPGSVLSVPPGIAPEFFNVPDQRPKTGLRLISVARLTSQARRKNIDGVLRAVAAIKNEFDVSYTVVGEGDDLPHLRTLATSLGVAGETSFVGRQSPEALRALYGQHHFFVMPVLPRRLDVEGFGMVYAEAAAAGLPSLGTATGGIPDAIRDGVTGFLLQDPTPQNIADSLRRFQRTRHVFEPNAIREFARSFSTLATSARIGDAIAGTLGPASATPLFSRVASQGT